jgi:hypothetical protein
VAAARGVGVPRRPGEQRGEEGGAVDRVHAVVGLRGAVEEPSAVCSGAPLGS